MGVTAFCREHAKCTVAYKTNGRDLSTVYGADWRRVVYAGFQTKLQLYGLSLRSVVWLQTILRDVIPYARSYLYGFICIYSCVLCRPVYKQLTIINTRPAFYATSRIGDITRWRCSVGGDKTDFIGCVTLR